MPDDAAPPLGSTLEPASLPGGVLPPHDGSGPLHIAFAVAAGDLDAWAARLEAEGVPIESRIDWPKGGRSLYLRDPDGHLLGSAMPWL